MCYTLGVLILLTSYNGSLGWPDCIGDFSIQHIYHEFG